MSNFRVTQEKINALLTELRTWDTDEDRYTLHELAKMFDLDVFIVGRIANSEDMHIKAGYRAEDDDREVDPNATTQDLDPEEVQQALEDPEGDGDYPEADTGVWKKKPTGEWELVNKKG